MVLHWLAAHMLLRFIDVDSGGRQWHPKTHYSCKAGQASGILEDPEKMPLALNLGKRHSN